jgi:hypothetical protein
MLGALGPSRIAAAEPYEPLRQEALSSPVGRRKDHQASSRQGVRASGNVGGIRILSLISTIPDLNAFRSSQPGSK